MPVLSHSDYKPPFFLFNGHLQTIAASQWRRVGGVVYQRQRIDTADDDFLDLDWARVGAQRLAIISHGLEGHSRRPYMLGMARALNWRGWDALSWNFRGCSGESNRQLRFYHSGATDDLQVVVDCALSRQAYRNIVLIGFSLGGNMILKYLGEERRERSPLIRKAVVFSVPCDLKDSAEQMDRPGNRIYLRRFLKKLKDKVRRKALLMPEQLCSEGLERISNFRAFDDCYTAPLHGFRDAEDYWEQNSSRHFLRGIEIPALIVNARNDPFLAGACYPIEETKFLHNVGLEIPEQGGHVGFPSRGGEYWSEKRALGFIEEAD
jgi:predicted alpha/beta-fold hydrolase